MTAAAIAPLKPPRDWFDRPEPDHPEPLTIDPDGRVHGHLALWDACHTGFLNGPLSECVKAKPSRSGYQGFHLGTMETAEGEMVPVGKVVYGGPHASLTAGLLEARAHYDRTSSVGAFVRARDGKHGIYLTGAARPDLTPEGLRDMRANPPSGDWRGMNGSLELIGALAVGVPGFQTPQVALTASGEGVEALILPGYSEVIDMEETVERGGASYTLRKRMISDSLDYLDVTAECLTAAAFTADQRARLAKTGAAMPDGSFPIRNCSDWQNARQAVGRAPAGKRPAVRAHIAKRGKALGCSED
ncbi:MAG TPA: hypothetical protein VGF24_37385 [Vicinamibacterales bacterium]|jgi:hypothetical protein